MHSQTQQTLVKVSECTSVIRFDDIPFAIAFAANLRIDNVNARVAGKVFEILWAKK